MSNGFCFFGVVMRTTSIKRLPPLQLVGRMWEEARHPPMPRHPGLGRREEVVAAAEAAVINIEGGLGQQGHATPPGQQHQFPGNTQGHPSGSALTNSVASYFDTLVSTASHTNNYCAGNFPSNAATVSTPNTVCQICFCSGYSAAACPQRYTTCPNQPMVLAFATFNTGETSDTVWFSDSAAASHMTPSEGPSHG